MNKENGKCFMFTLRSDYDLECWLMICLTEFVRNLDKHVKKNDGEQINAEMNVHVGAVFTNVINMEDGRGMEPGKENEK